MVLLNVAMEAGSWRSRQSNVKKEQEAKWSPNIKWSLLYSVDGGHAEFPNRVLLYQHLYSWEILSPVKTGEKRCVWVFIFLPEQSFTIGTLTFKIFFISKLLKLCGSNFKERHLFLGRLTWLLEILQIYCIAEVELGRESLPNCNQAGTTNCFETISLLFPLLFFSVMLLWINGACVILLSY